MPNNRKAGLRQEITVQEGAALGVRNMRFVDPSPDFVGQWKFVKQRTIDFAQSLSYMLCAIGACR